MSILPYEYYAPHIQRSVREAVYKYQAEHGKRPAIIFAGSIAYKALVSGLDAKITKNDIRFANIPLEFSPREKYAVYLAGDPVQISLIEKNEPVVNMNGGTI